MNRDAYLFVRGLTICRGVFGLTLPFWAAFVTDMVDGELARAWKVVTLAGEKLDGRADAALTFGALVALTVSGGWSWFILAVLSLMYLGLGWMESKLRDQVLFWFVMLVPAVYLTLIGLMVPRFVQLAYGGSYWALLFIESIVAAIIGCLKAWRIANYVEFARSKRDGGSGTDS